MSCSINNEEANIENENLDNLEIATRNEGDSCFSDEELDPNDCESFSQIVSFNLNEYPGCTFQVEFSYVKCVSQFSNIRYYHISSLQLKEHDCVDYDNDVLAARLNGTLAQFSLDFDQLLYNAVLDYLGQFPNSFGTIVVKYITASCVKFCYFNEFKSGAYYYTYYRTICGEDCCEIETDYQWDSQGNLISHTTSATGPLEPCDATFTGSCGPGSLFSTDCTYRCDSFL